MVKTILFAVGILWITCSFFLYGGIRSDSLPSERPEKLPLLLSGTKEKDLLAEEEFIRLFSRLPDGQLREKKEWESFFSLLDKTPDSIFLNSILIQSYRQIKEKKEKVQLAERLALLSRKHPGNGILGAMASDILAEAGRKKEAQKLLEFHLAFLLDQPEEVRKKYISRKALQKDYLLYMARSCARFQLSSTPPGEREKALRNYLELFPDDLILLQLLLRARYEAMEKAEEKKPFLPFADSPREKWKKAFYRTAENYLLQCRKKLRNGESLHLGRYHNTGLFFLEKTPWKEEAKNLLLEECMPKYPALDFEEMIALASLFEKEDKPLFTAVTLLRLLREEVFPCNTFHFLLAEEKLRNFQSEKLRIQLGKLTILSDPENPRAAFPLILVLMETNREKEAWQILQELFPHPLAYKFAAERMYTLGKWEKANEYLKKAIAGFKYPPGGNAQKDLIIFQALLLDRAGKKREAEKLLRDLLKIHKESHDIMNFLGYLLADENRLLSEAESLIRKALSKAKNQAYMDSLAWVCYRQKKYKEAVRHIEEALTLTPEGEEPDSLIYDHAGDIYFAAGEKKKALQYREKAVSCYSPEYDLAGILAKIRKVRGEKK